MIHTAKGNLLEAPTEALVNTVNTVGVMGKGIALQVRQAYPEVFLEYQRACKAGEVKLGQMHLYDRGERASPRWIINFPTKGDWRKRSRIEHIESGLQDLRRVILSKGIRSISVPPLGCGNGGLDWKDVRPLIERELRDLPDTTVLLFAPGKTPAAAEMPNRTQTPRMTKPQAIVIALLDRYLRGLLDPCVTLLELHKLLYFMHTFGSDLRLRYEGRTYGPYAKNLRHLLIKMESHYLTGYGTGEDDPSAALELLPNAVDAANAALRGEHDTLDQIKRLDKLIEGYEDPFGLELLSSLHWVIVNTPGAADDIEIAIQALHGWSARKRRMFKRDHIIKAWKRLKQCRSYEVALA
jgi:O-acetyl-ADP-ribose deacetylase (regulator of RNase III)